MTLNGCAMTSGGMALKYRISKPVTLKPPVSFLSHLPIKVAFPSIRSTWETNLEQKSWPARGWQPLHFSASSATLLSGVHDSLLHTIPVLPKKHGTAHNSRMVPRASKDVPSDSSYPPMMEKPRWYWRTLACIPYLLPLHETWMYAKTTYNLHPFFFIFKKMARPFLLALGKLPNWFLLAYFITAYLFVVRNNRLPHFVRFHVVMGMLLEITLQVTGTLSRWMPRGLYWGKFGMHFWIFMGFGFLFTVLEAIRCALRGMYADIPFVSDAAYIQMPNK